VNVSLRVASGDYSLASAVSKTFIFYNTGNSPWTMFGCGDCDFGKQLSEYCWSVPLYPVDIAMCQYTEKAVTFHNMQSLNQHYTNAHKARGERLQLPKIK